MTNLLENGFIDTYRYLYPDQEGVYSWWSYRFNARKNNAGWRIDYFIVSDCLKEGIKEAFICTDILGSDHCPVGLEIDVKGDCVNGTSYIIIISYSFRNNRIFLCMCSVQ